MTLTEWQDWIGLPHEIEADPREGRAACCVKVAGILLSNAGLPFPEIDPAWYEQARAKRWEACLYAFQKHTEPIPEPELWSMAWVTNGTAGYGIGTVVQNNMLLLPHHKRGVMAIPIHLIKPLDYFRLKP